MKTTRRIFAMLLCLMMVFAMSITAYAEGEETPATYTITINSVASGYTYEAYQVFAGDLTEDGVLSNVTWGANVDDTIMNGEKDIYAVLAEANAAFANLETKSAAAVADVLADNAADKQVAEDFAAAIEAYLTKGSPVTSVAGESYTETNTTNTIYPYTISDLDAGYYFVKNTTVPATDASYTNYILKITNDVKVNHKGTYATVEKKILDPDAVDVNNAAIGETVTYRLTGTLPANISDYNEYFYKFTDTLSAGLKYDAQTADLTVKIDNDGDENDMDVTKYFYGVAADDEASKTVLTVGIQDLLALKNAGAVISASTKIVVEYKATVDTDAVIAGIGNPNDVVLKYSNDPNNSGNGTTETPSENPSEEPKPDTDEPTGDTPKDEVVTYVTKLTVLKVDEEGDALSGATFKLEGPDGYSKEEAVDANGTLVFNGLAAGTYTLTETDTPDGYNDIDPITFTITFADNTFKVSDEEKLEYGIVDTDGVIIITVENVSGSLLPSTGGIGTTLFYVVGGFLAMAALVVLVAKRRVEAE